MYGVSLWVLIVLLTVLAASWLMLSVLMRRWTLGRRRARLTEWAAKRGLQPTDALPAFLKPLLSPLGGWRMVAGYASATGFLICIRAERTPASTHARDPSTWIFAGRKASHPMAIDVAALRPASRATSLVDILAADATPIVWSYPSVEASDHFTIFAGSPIDARAIADSPLPAKVPPDVGLLVAQGWLVADVSERPLDEVEADTTMRLLQALVAATAPAPPKA